MKSVIRQDDDVSTILENGNFFGPGKEANEAAADIRREISALRMILIGAFACFIISEIVSQFLVIAAAGSLLLLIGALRLKGQGTMSRVIMLCAAVQMLWRAALVVCSYIPQTDGSVVLLAGRYAFALLSLIQLLILHRFVVQTNWIGFASKIPVAAICYVLLVTLGHFGGELLFAVRVLLGIIAALQLYQIYGYANTENS